MSSETNSIDQMPKKSPLSFQVDLKKFEKATDEEKRQQDLRMQVLEINKMAANYFYYQLRTESGANRYPSLKMVCAS